MGAPKAAKQGTFTWPFGRCLPAKYGS